MGGRYYSLLIKAMQCGPTNPGECSPIHGTPASRGRWSLAVIASGLPYALLWLSAALDSVQRERRPKGRGSDRRQVVALA
jgi:hypothetical protein